MTDFAIPDYYAVLGISADASTDEIRQARNREAKFWSPDLYPAQSDHDRERRTKMSVQINAAWEVLGDEEKRREYDPILTELKSIGSQLAIVVSAKGNGNYMSISDAIDNNVMDCPIIVLPGVYQESIVLDGSYRLIGLPLLSDVHIRSDGVCLTSLNGSSFVRGVKFSTSGHKPCISIRGSSLNLEDCAISSSKGASAIEVGGAKASLLLRSATVGSGNGNGISAFHGPDITLKNCVIRRGIVKSCGTDHDQAAV